MEKRKMLRILDHAAVSEEERRQARRGEREVGAEDKEAMDKEPKDKEVVVVEESGTVEREQRRVVEESGAAEMKKYVENVLTCSIRTKGS